MARDPLHASILEADEVVEAGEAADEARERRDDVAEELQDLESRVESLEEDLEATVEEGDPRGEVREMSASLRDLRGKLEDVGRDVEAHDAALEGARRTRFRAILGVMDGAWSDRDPEEAAETFRRRLVALADAIDALESLFEERDHARDWARAIVGDKLNGDGTFPRLSTPDLGGLRPPEFGEVAATVLRAAETVRTNEED